MEKELPPPYPGEPLNVLPNAPPLPGFYRGPHCELYPHPDFSPEAALAVGHPGGVPYVPIQTGPVAVGPHGNVYPHPDFSPEAAFTVGHPGGVQYAPVQTGYVKTGPGQAGAVTVVTHVISSSGLGELPGYTECPHCCKIVLTTTKYTPGLMTWLACAGIALFAWPCCWVPFCIKACKNVKHHCPDCKKLVYKYTRM